MDTIYYIKYLNYKNKYLQLKKITQKGGNDIMMHLEKMIELKNIINKSLILIEKLEPTYLTKSYFEWNEMAKDSSNKMRRDVNNLKNYIINNNIPVECYNSDFTDIEKEYFVRFIQNFETIYTVQKLEDLYKLRGEIYDMNENNMENTLDFVLTYFNINSLQDIENIFESNIMGSNMNYIVYYMVLFKYLLKTKKQLSVIDDNIPYLSSFNLYTSLNPINNDDEYLPLILKQIKTYINSFPIKKVIVIKRPPTTKKEIGHIPAKISNYMIKYDTKNKIFIYESNDMKQEDQFNFDDLVQILYNLFRIKSF